MIHNNDAFIFSTTAMKLSSTMDRAPITVSTAINVRVNSMQVGIMVGLYGSMTTVLLNPVGGKRPAILEDRICEKDWNST